MFDGVSTTISCKDYLYTPHRNVSSIVNGTSNLPIVGSSDLLANQLTDNDADILGVRLLPMNFVNAHLQCATDQDFYQLDPGGFQGETGTSLQRVWNHYRGRQPRGFTPLGYILGYDDALPSDTNNIIINDALYAFDDELKTDPSVKCRPQFVIMITDGMDTCTRGLDNAGVGWSSSRASVKAVNNLRTFFLPGKQRQRG